MLMETETNRCNIVVVFELGGPRLNLSRLCTLVDSTLLASRPASATVAETNAATSKPLLDPLCVRFHQRPLRVRGVWHWQAVGQAFNLEAHVREEPNISNERSLALAVARLQSEKMDLNRPLWDVRLAAPGFNQGTVLLVRVHHAMGDGMALMRVLLQAIAPDAPPGTLPAQVGHRGFGLAAASKVASWLQCLLFAPLIAVEQLLERRDAGILKPGHLSGRKCVALSPPIELPRVRAVARRHGSTISAVTAACFARSLSCTGVASSIRNGTPIAKFWVPVSLDAVRGKSATLQNNLCYITMPIPLNSASALEALAAADKSLKSIKSSNKVLTLSLIMNAILALLPFSLAEPLLNLISDKASGVFSSVPGPASTIHWGQHPISSLAFLVPQRSTVTVGFSALSYAGNLRIAVSADEAALRDPHPVVNGWQDALEELERAAEGISP